MVANIVKLIIKTKVIFRGEVLFALFLLAGNFKSSLVFLPDFFDLTVFFLGLSILIAIKRLMIKPTISKCSIESIIIYLIFIAVILGSIFYTLSSVYAIEKSLKFLIITGWSYVGVFFLIKSESSLKYFLNTIIFVGLVMSGIAIYKFVFVQKLEMSFVSVLGSNYLALGRTVGISIIILLNYFIIQKKGIKAIFFIIIILQLTIALLISGGKMPLLSLIIILFFYFLYSIISRSKNFYLRKSIKKSLLLIFLLTPLIIILAKLGMFDVVMMRLYELFKSAGSDTSAVGRITRYFTALDMWGDKPLIGNGIGSFSLFYNGTDIRDYPHNICLEILSELGILGFGVFVSLIGTSLYNGLIVFKNKFKEIDSLQIVLLLVFLYLFINANVSGSLNDNRLMFTFISLLSTSPYIERKVGDISENMYINDRS